MLLKRVKIVYILENRSVRFFRVPDGESCDVCKYYNTPKCLSPVVCGHYIFHLEFKGRFLKHLRYMYFIDQNYDS